MSDDGDDWEKRRKAEREKARKDGWDLRWECPAPDCGQVNSVFYESCWNCGAEDRVA